MALKVSKSVHKALEAIKGQTLVFQTRQQLASKLCGSCNSSGGGLELWLGIVSFLEQKEVLTIEDITEEDGRKVTLIKVKVHDKGLRLAREDLRELNGLRKRRVESDRQPGYVYRPMGAAA